MKNKIGNMETIFLTLICTVIIIILNTCYAQNDKTMMYKEWEREVLKNRQYIPKELNKLTDSSRIVREKTVDFLIRTPDPRSIQPLVQLLKTEEIASIRKDAIKALGAIVNYEKQYKSNIIKVLKDALNDSSIIVRLEASEILIKYNEGECTINTLMEIFKKRHYLFEKPLLYWIKNEVCRPDMSNQEQIELAKYAIKQLPESALKKLIKIGSDEVIAELKNCLKSHDEWIQKKAKEAINYINISKTE